MRPRVPVLVAVLAAGALPAAASAATWSPPQDLSSPHAFVNQPGLTISGDGTALASWGWSDATGSEGRVGVDGAVRSPAAAAFGPERRLSPSRPFSSESLVTGPVAFGRDRAVLATTRAVNRDPANPRLRLAARFGTDGYFGRARPVRTALRLREVRLAVNARGDAVLAWWEDRGVRTDRVYASLRPAGGRFGAPIRLATGRIRGVGAAIGASGHVLVSWDARGVVRTRFKRPGRPFRPADTIRSRDAFNADMSPAVAPNGRAVVAWSAQFTSEGGGSGPVYFEVAVRAAGARRFKRAQTLEQLGRGEVPRSIDQVVDSTGRHVVAWSGSDGPNARVRVAFMDEDGRFHAQPDISPPGVNGQVADLAAGPAGRLLVLWDDWDLEASHQVLAAYAPGPGEPFGPPEAVSPVQEARAGAAAFDPRTGVPTVVWTNRPEGSGRRPIQTFAQASTRTP
jgi:hypothetical protein